MPTSTYPKQWKSRFIFVSPAMIPESPSLREAEATIEDSIPALSADEIVQWKRMYGNPTRAFTFSEGILAMGGLSPSYSVRPRAFFGKKGILVFLTCRFLVDSVEVTSAGFPRCEVCGW
ncbi:hypothetical protein Hdeb2414_s0004g00145541 [Helianthus debilis subsp. tardiflorus]